MLDFPQLSDRCARALRLTLPLLLLLLQPLAGSSQTPDASTLPSIPAVPDEPGQAPALRVNPAATEPPVMTLAQKMSQSTLVAQTREEIRRAFIKQDYEKVLALSQDLRVKYSMEETGDYYVAAAQLRLTEQKALKDGKRSYERINDRPPALPASLPSVEPAPKQVASLPSPASAASPAASPVVKPAVTEATPGEGNLISAAATPAATPPAAGTANPSPEGAAATPVASPAASPAAAAAETPAAAIAPGTPAAQSPDKMIASAAIPAATPIAASIPTGAAPVVPSATTTETIGLAVIGAAIVFLALVFFVKMRRDSQVEPAEDLATTLGGLSFENEAPATAPAARRNESPSPAAEATARLGTATESIFDEETVEAPKAKKPAPAAPKAPAPKPAPPRAEAPKPKPSPPAKAPDDDVDPFNFANMTLEMPPVLEDAMPPKKESAKARTVFEEIDSMTDEIMARPSINLDDLPPAAETPAWKPAEDAVSIEGIGDEPASEEVRAAAAREQEALELPMAAPEVAPESAETRDVEHPAAKAPGAPGASAEKTKTSWDLSEDKTEGLSGSAGNEDLPQMQEAVEAREFRQDETINLRPDGSYGGEETIATDQAGGDENETLGGQTQTSEPYAESGSEDLFDRERREGKSCFDRNDWGGAVHHLSVAAALRPEHHDVKEMLREARRMRKSKERR